MKIFYDPTFYKKLKTVDIRIRKSLKESIFIFSKNPHDPQLHNHSLTKNYTGYRSINVTADYRAIYKEVSRGDEVIAYFIAFGTHQELYEIRN